MKEYVDYIEICGEKVTAQDGSDIIKRMNRKRKKASILLRKIRKCCKGYKFNLKNYDIYDSKYKKSFNSMLNLISDYKVEYELDKDKVMSLKVHDKYKIVPKYKVPKPNKELFYKNIIGNLEFSLSRDGYGRADTEQYSACGYDDGIGYQKEYAIVSAVENWRAFRELAFPNKKKYNDIRKDERQCFMFLRQQGLFMNECL